MNKLALALLCAATGSVYAQTANDNGAPFTRGNFNFGVVPTISTMQRGGPVCPPTGAVNAAFSGANTQLGRIFRDGVAGACPTKPYPGIFNSGTTYNYESFTYTNTGAAPTCVTVNFNPDTAAGTPCATNAHASAYAGSYNPANQAANFLNDVGSSVTQPFLFEIPAGQNLVLVVSNTSAQAICNFEFEVLNLPCTAGTATLGVSTTNLAFGPQSVGGTTPRTLTITNVGTANLNVTTLSAPAAPFAVAAGGTCGAVPFTLAAGASCTVNYSFTPTTAGAASGLVNIDSNGGSLTVNLTGTGVVAIPLNTLSGVSLGLLAGLFGLSALVLVRRRG